MTRVNIGCGQTPTATWLNFDGSFSLRLARHPLIAKSAQTLGLLDKNQRSFVEFAAKHDIAWADATRHIPLPDGSVEVLYSSHMVEHLYPQEARAFLTEALRVLQSGGLLRLAVPDLERMAKRYIERGDADAFVAATHLSIEDPRTIVARVKRVLIGARHHRWMYDGTSLCRLLSEAGFQDPRVQPPGETRIPNPDPLNLRERDDESVYVEALR